MNEVLVVDVESTCWESKAEQPVNESSEIIEIGISVVDIKKLKIISSDSIMVRPQFSTISDFCTQLTSITDDMVKDALCFTSACEKLKTDYKSHNKTMISWGDYDRKMFENNCREHECNYPFGRRHLNLKNCFTLLHGLPREPGMDGALNLLNLRLEGVHHRGVWDSYNISNILIHTIAKFREINPTYEPIV